ncbi:TlpA family protein disulfide reductase [Subtercola endophyticus]|uniref:TlpA family protein disulfide reductase n=1 Tax=Subtercola endophyticus TaxID=2895559 RepID=UPI001E464A1F|nr:TlpA disulfide reductase family protein [Subtercola endophyticus]UFS58030.1 TlpA family protein disulfide reductase [Subtercola endophyticus]
MKLRRTLLAVTAAALALGVLAGCSSDPLADQYRNGDNKQYIAGDGTVTEIAAENRGAVVNFTGTTQDGSAVDSSKYLGQVLVLNFWYAGCAPCRAEAPALQKLNAKYTGNGATFLGVNVRDQPATAVAFDTSFGITYNSVIDTNGAVQLALSGQVAPDAVPTTLVIDKKGRVAARILGQATAPDILDTLIGDAVAEKS